MLTHSACSTKSNLTVIELHSADGRKFDQASGDRMAVGASHAVIVVWPGPTFCKWHL